MSNQCSTQADSRQRAELRQKLQARINRRVSFDTRVRDDQEQKDVAVFSEKKPASVFAKEDLYVQEEQHHTNESKQREIKEREEHYEQVYRSLIQMTMEIAQQIRGLLYSKLGCTERHEPW
tara:strand:+ start:113 stop:475 length:363 start_codon:yes stop_codon:yes gene_type:complete